MAIGRQLTMGCDYDAKRVSTKGQENSLCTPSDYRAEKNEDALCLVTTLVLSVDQAEEIIVHVVLTRTHRNQLETLREKQRVARGTTNDQLARHEDEHRRRVHTHLHLLCQTSHIMHNGSNGLLHNIELVRRIQSHIILGENGTYGVLLNDSLRSRVGLALEGQSGASLLSSTSTSHNISIMQHFPLQKQNTYIKGGQSS